MTSTLDSRQTSTRERQYRYKAFDASGEVTRGEMVGTSTEDVVARLHQQGVRPISINERRMSAFERDFSIPGLKPRVKGADLAVLARQFSTMANAGVPLLRTLEVLSSQTENDHLRASIEQVQIDVESGSSLSEALGRHGDVFDRLFISMIRAGETSGALDTVLAQLAGTMERNVAIRQKIRSALAYPLAVMVMVTVVIAVMLVFVVPTFAGIYDDLGGTLPLPTQILVSTSSVITSNLVPIVIGLTIAAFGFRRWKQTPSGRYRWDSVKLRIPLVGELLVKSGMARFGRTMAVLTRAGVPVLETLRIAADTVGNEVLAKAIRETRAGVQRGESIAQNLSRHDVFPAMIVQLVTVGEESGALEDMFETIGSSLEEEVETSVSGFAALIEPLIMAFIGVVVGAMVIALYLPMFRIIDLVQ